MTSIVPVLLLLASAPGSAAPPASAPSAEPAEPASTDDAQPSKRRALRLAVYPLKTDGLDARLSDVATDGVATEIRKLQRVSVIAMDEIKAMLDLEASKQLTGCSDDSCLAEIADSLGVDGVVIGTVAKVGEQVVFGLKRIDQRSASVVASATKSLPSAEGDGVLGAIGPIVAELFPDFELKPGMSRGVDEALVKRLYPPPVPVWGFFAAAGGTAALAVVAGGAGALNLVLADDYRRFLEASVAAKQPVAGTEVKSREGAVFATGVVSLTALSLTAVGAASLGVLALFTDWNDEAGTAGDEVAR